MTGRGETDGLRCVLDASVAVKWVLNEESSDSAHDMLIRLTESNTRYHIPSLFYVELANVLWKRGRRGDIGEAAAREALVMLRALPLIIHPVESLVGLALDIALEHGIAAYDATYIALSELLRLPLITADDVLWRKLHSLFDLRLLSGELP